MRSSIMIFLALLTCGCSIVTYEIRNELSESKILESCDVHFTLTFQSSHFSSSFGERPHEKDVLQEIKDSYIKSTQNTLNSLGCTSKIASNASESNFKIEISRQLKLSALPQEWLTGLSLGLIPSWGTKQGQYVFSFTNNVTGQSHSYIIDQHNYNHLVLFPVFWVTFFTADEQRAYVHALTNFIKSS